MEEYSWKNTEVILGSRTLVNVEEVSYKMSTELEVFTDMEGQPNSWGQGDTKGEGSLKVSKQEWQHIIDFAVAQGYDLLKMPPLPLIIRTKSSDLRTINHVLSGIKFKEDGFSGKNKDKRFLQDLPFVIVGPRQIVPE